MQIDTVQAGEYLCSGYDVRLQCITEYRLHTLAEEGRKKGQCVR